MIYEETINGKYTSLRSVTPEDAEFVIRIRNDKTRNQYLHETSTDIKKQIEWISSQNRKRGDYYFIISNQCSSIALASIYDIDEHNRTAEFGRWISEGNAIENVETVILIFDFAFHNLQLDKIYMLTMVENKKVRNFWKTFGAKIEGQFDKNGILVEKEVVHQEEYFGSIRPKNVKLLRY